MCHYTCSADADKKARAGAEKEYSFLEAPPKDFFCPVMFSLLLEPHQTSCCGKHLSADAISKISGKCPMCKKEEFSTTLDKHFKRQVQELLVFCSYRMRGCGFMAEIAEMERHVLQCSHKNSRITSKPLGMFVFTNGAEESVIVSEVSSFQRLKCTQEWYMLGVGKGVLFREVSLVQECPHREREREVLACVCVWPHFRGMQEWYLGCEKVSCLERCPQFRSVLIEKEV